MANHPNYDTPIGTQTTSFSLSFQAVPADDPRHPGDHSDPWHRGALFVGGPLHGTTQAAPQGLTYVHTADIPTGYTPHPAETVEVTYRKQVVGRNEDQRDGKTYIHDVWVDTRVKAADENAFTTDAIVLAWFRQGRGYPA